MKSAFGSVSKMLSGKAFPMNVRALRLVLEEILSSYIGEISSYNDFDKFLDETALRSRTAKHWTNNFIRPVLLMMLFVRSEREGDWPLYLYACWQMLPYFFAAGHTNYARYGSYYLQNIQGQGCFLKGKNVIHLQDGRWNDIWSYMGIETTYMRHGKSAAEGLVGNPLNPVSVKKVCLSMHTCAEMKSDLEWDMW